MFLSREVNTDALILVRRPKPDTSTLTVGDRVCLNGIAKGSSLPVVAIDRDVVTIEWEYPDGRSQREVIPRLCLRKVWLPSLWNHICDVFKKV